MMQDYVTSQSLKEYEQELGTSQGGSGAVGKIISIPKINLKMPIKEGATYDNMKEHVATIGKNSIEEGQNYAIAGHRYIKKGRHFNRLDELYEGDKIQIATDSGNIDFFVTSKEVVLPQNVEVLNNSGSTELTLITCHPPGISTHRLIIKAKKGE